MRFIILYKDNYNLIIKQVFPYTFNFIYVSVAIGSLPD